MYVAPGWHPDENGVVRYWNGSAWDLAAPPAEQKPGVASGPVAIRTEAALAAAHSEAPASGAGSEPEQGPVTVALEQLVDAYPGAWRLPSVTLDGDTAGVDHLLVVGRIVFVIDTAYWPGAHDYLLQLDAEFEPPTWWVEGQPVDPNSLHDRVVRWGRDAAAGWESFDESTVRLRRKTEQLARETGLADQQHYQMVPVLVVVGDDVTARIDTDQPTWFQFTSLAQLPAAVAAVTAAAPELAAAADPALREQLLAHQAARPDGGEQDDSVAAVPTSPPLPDTAQQVGTQPTMPQPTAPAEPAPQFQVEHQPQPQAAAYQQVVPAQHVVPAQQPGYPPQHGSYPAQHGGYPVQQVGYPVYAQPAARPQQSNGLATAGFVVGLVSIFLPLLFGLAVGVTGLVLSIVGLNRAKFLGAGRGLGIAGVVLSSIGILFIL